MILGILTILYFPELSHATTDGGSCGSNCQWIYDLQTKTLTITGTKQDSYSPKQDQDGVWHTTAPWVKYERQIERAVVADTFDTITSHSFYSLHNLKDVTLPKNLKIIRDQTFHNTSLESVNIPDTVTYIGSAAFQSTKLKNVILPDSVKTIESHAFDSESFQSIVIGNGVTSIGKNAFKSLPDNAKIYCQDTKVHKCDEIINDSTYGADKIVKYTKESAGFISANGKRYSSFEKLVKGIEMKRIYTVEEAEKVSKKTGNTLKIKYK